MSAVFLGSCNLFRVFWPCAGGVRGCRVPGQCPCVSWCDLWSSLAVTCGIFSLAPTRLVCFILIFTFPQQGAGKEGSSGVAELEAAQGRYPHSCGTRGWECQKCQVPLATPHCFPGTSQCPQHPWHQLAPIPQHASPTATLLLHHPSKQEVPLPFPTPRAELEEAEFSCVLFSP